jgi:hypothetical protein
LHEVHQTLQQDPAWLREAPSTTEERTFGKSKRIEREVRREEERRGDSRRSHVLSNAERSRTLKLEFIADLLLPWFSHAGRHSCKQRSHRIPLESTANSLWRKERGESTKTRPRERRRQTLGKTGKLGKTGMTSERSVLQARRYQVSPFCRFHQGKKDKNSLSYYGLPMRCCFLFLFFCFPALLSFEAEFHLS